MSSQAPYGQAGGRGNDRGLFFTYLDSKLASLIVDQAAEEARKKSQFSQAIQLYSLADQDELVAEILIERLADICKESQRNPERQERERQARELLQRTEGHRPLHRDSKRALDVLWALINFFNLYHSSTLNYDAAEAKWNELLHELERPGVFKSLRAPVRQAFADVADALYRIYRRQYQDLRETTRVYRGLEHTEAHSNLQAKVERLRDFIANISESIGPQNELQERLVELLGRV